jgi:hypothetical protein
MGAGTSAAKDADKANVRASMKEQRPRARLSFAIDEIVSTRRILSCGKYRFSTVENESGFLCLRITQEVLMRTAVVLLSLAVVSFSYACSPEGDSGTSGGTVASQPGDQPGSGAANANPVSGPTPTPTPTPAPTGASPATSSPKLCVVLTSGAIPTNFGIFAGAGASAQNVRIKGALSAMKFPWGLVRTQGQWRLEIESSSAPPASLITRALLKGEKLDAQSPTTEFTVAKSIYDAMTGATETVQRDLPGDKVVERASPDRSVIAYHEHAEFPQLTERYSVVIRDVEDFGPRLCDDTLLDF